MINLKIGKAICPFALISFLFSVCTYSVTVVDYQELLNVKLHVQANTFLAEDKRSNEDKFLWFIRTMTFFCVTAQDSYSNSKIEHFLDAVKS